MSHASPSLLPPGLASTPTHLRVSGGRNTPSFPVNQANPSSPTPASTTPPSTPPTTTPTSIWHSTSSPKADDDNDARALWTQPPLRPPKVEVAPLMSLQLFIASTGSRYSADSLSLGGNGLDGLKSWIAKQTGIPSGDQILLTGKGKHVRNQNLLTESEIYVYDRELFRLDPHQDLNALVPPTPIPEPFEPEEAPVTLEYQNDLRSWQDLFKRRREWAKGCLEANRSQYRTAQKHLAEQAVVDRALRVATVNHDSHIQAAETKYAEARDWFDGVTKEQDTSVKNLERDLQQLERVPAKSGFTAFIAATEDKSGQVSGRRGSNMTTLRDFIDNEAINRATTTGRKVSKSFGKRMAEMGNTLEKINAEYNGLAGAVSQTHSQSSSAAEHREEPTRLYQEIEAVAKKVASDHEHVGTLASNSKSVAQVSKMALLHTRNYLPALQEYSEEMNDLVKRAVETKNSAVQRAMENMQSIARIESMLATINSDLGNLDIPPEGLEAFELIALVSRLPYAYGALLIEAVRRVEWGEKMKRDASTLAEEMAGYQEEEEKRRRRWLKNVGDIISVEAQQGRPTSFEINVRGEENKWPEVSRQEIADYTQLLRQLQDAGETVELLNQAMRDLERPTKQQVKRAKGFKNGSVHEAAFGKASLMLRGEDEMRVLQEANGKLEDELKGSKSRVRKLEDLLHRQSTSRLSIGPDFQSQTTTAADPYSPAAASPRLLPDDHSRRSSIDPRQTQVNQTPDNQALVRRIAELEGELAAERDNRTDAEKELTAMKEADSGMQRQIDEIQSTKKDLMENMDSKQREFADERRALKEEVANHKIRNEELEDELERVLGSRDNEKTGTDTKMQSLEEEIDQIRDESAEDVKNAQEEVNALQTVLRKRDQQDAEQRVALTAAYAYLATNSSFAPHDTVQLVTDLEDLAQRSRDHAMDLEQAIAIAKSDGEHLRTRLEGQNAGLASQIEQQEAELLATREHLDTERANASSLESELNDERKHLEDLRSKFAEGETGSEALRQRVADEEAKVMRLSSDLAAARSHVNSLDVELFGLQKKYIALQESIAGDGTRLKERTSRAKDLSNKVFAQNDRLVRLLETLGYTVNHQDEQMVVQRISKTGNSTILPRAMSESKVSTGHDPSEALASAVITPATEKRLDLSCLQWAESADADEETVKYNAFQSQLSHFNLDTFCEAVLKRAKDLEHTARKWQKEARSYRDKSHQARSDASEKIAFRNFKEGDLALFLPTRNQATRPWAAFNVGAPHYFLREQEGHKLPNKEWLVARISRIEERVVDLSKNLTSSTSNRASSSRSINSQHSQNSETPGQNAENDNPFELSDGLRWYLLDAYEEGNKLGSAPFTPVLPGKATTASACVDARGTMRVKGKSSTGVDATKTLNKSLESRRSSQGSRKSFVASINPLNRTGSSGSLVGEGQAAEQQAQAAAQAQVQGQGNQAKRPSHLRSTSSASDAHRKIEGLLERSGSASGSVPGSAQSMSAKPLPLPSSPAAARQGSGSSRIGTPIREQNQQQQQQQQDELAATSRTRRRSSISPVKSPIPPPSSSNAASPGNKSPIKKPYVPSPAHTQFLLQSPQSPQASSPSSQMKSSQQMPLTSPSTPSKTTSGIGNGSPSKPSATSATPVSSSDSPTKQGQAQPPTTSPSKGIWNSLFQFDVSIEKGKARR